MSVASVLFTRISALKSNSTRPLGDVILLAIANSDPRPNTLSKNDSALGGTSRVRRVSPASVMVPCPRKTLESAPSATVRTHAPARHIASSAQAVAALDIESSGNPIFMEASSPAIDAVPPAIVAPPEDDIISGEFALSSGETPPVGISAPPDDAPSLADVPAVTMVFSDPSVSSPPSSEHAGIQT